MGLFKKVFRPIRKVAKKIIPKEIKPFLPYIAASFGPVGAGTFSSGIKAALQRGLIAGATSAATDEEGNPLRAGILAATPGLIADTAQLGAVNAELAGMGKTAGALERTTDFIRANEGLKTIGAQTALDQSAKFAEIRQDEIDEYNRSLQEQGVLDKTKRRTAIFNIYKNAGYEDDYVNSMLDRYGYESGGITRIGFKPGGKVLTMEELLEKTGPIVEKIESTKVEDEDEDEEDAPKRKKDDLAGGLMAAADGVQKAFGRSFGNMEPVPMLRFARGGEVEEGIMSKIIDSMGDDYDYFTRIKMRENLKQGETVEDAADLAEQEAIERVKEKYGFARGGEVEIEEQVDDLGIMDLMKDQGIPYGEQASYGFDDAMGETFEMFLDYKKKGTIPMEMEFDEFLELLQGRKEQGIKGTQVASGYKDDIEEMYEQYVFEMEEQGLEPMDFASFLRQARSGMAKGGMMKGPDWFTQRIEDLMYQGLSYEEASEQAYNEGPGGGYKDGGKVKRRKKGEPADEVIETEEEIFLDKMPRPKRKGIMEVASGGMMNKNLLNTGMDKDMRGGGFIPEGTKEKADDVPARLSKNEFVMTADAVRAAGGGSVNKGAKRMYDLMYTLEAKV
jgi:hypothetical protein